MSPISRLPVVLGAWAVLAIVAPIQAARAQHPAGRGENQPKAKAERERRAPAIRYIERVIRTVEAMTPPTKAAVEKLLDVSLQPDPNFLPPNPHNLLGIPRSGPFSSVDLQEPRNDKTDGLWIFGFTLREELHFQLKEFDPELVGPSYGIHTHDMTWRYTLKRNGGLIQFRVGSRAGVVEVVVQRKTRATH
jgi:hypothetical protein